MDSNRFEDLLRALSAKPSRRGIGRAVAGLTLGGLLVPLFEPLDGEGKKGKGKGKGKGKKKKCKGKKKCGKKCIPKDACCTDTDCDEGESCCSGVCTAPVFCGEEETCGCDEICKAENEVFACQAGSCPAGADPCNDTDLFICGATSDCICATSVEDETVCADVAGGMCVECTTDAQCIDELDQPAICLDLGTRCSCGIPTATACVPIGCSSDSAPRSARSGSSRDRIHHPLLGR